QTSADRVAVHQSSNRREIAAFVAVLSVKTPWRNDSNVDARWYCLLVSGTPA
uniref:Uncharacterized protein n=1 Tax=Oryza brachyantha TaxID=4533 RepID=J3MC22_ORYBR